MDAPGTASNVDRPLAVPLADDGRLEAVVLVVMAMLVTLLLHTGPLLAPKVAGDDFQMLRASWDATATWEHFLVPHNEHIMPPGRVTIWGMVLLAGTAERVPWLAAWHGPLAVLIGMALVGWLVWRETDDSRTAVISLAFFGITTQYAEAVSWFSASFGIVALDTLLLGLIAAQAWCRAGRAGPLIGCGLLAGLAPGWFATGVLAGPLIAVYLLWPGREPRSSRSRWLAALVPLLGTVLFLALTVPANYDRLMHLEHYGNETAREAIQPVRGMLYTARSLIDNLVLGTLGFARVHLPVGWLPLALLCLVGVTMWWLATAKHRRLVVLGIAMVLLSYLLIYSGRARWEYEQVSSWGRYQLWSHLGLTLVLAGGLSRWQGLVERPPPATILVFGGLAMLGLGVTQLPRAIPVPSHREQQALLRRVDEIDARCRALRISAEQARRVLPTRWLYYASEQTNVNAWEFLRGSPNPIERDDPEVMQLLWDEPGFGGP